VLRRYAPPKHLRPGPQVKERLLQVDYPSADT
jgi:hypothetical protein